MNQMAAAVPVTNELGDDRDSIGAGDQVLLVVDNDHAFTSFLIEMAHEHGIKVLAATRGGIALALARQYQPTAMVLDIKLPDIDGWRVLQSVKNDLATRHIPVHIVSNDDERDRAMHQGAFGMSCKPVTRDQMDRIFSGLLQFALTKKRRLLVIDDDSVLCEHVSTLVGGEDVETEVVGTVSAAQSALGTGAFDCVVLDLWLPDSLGSIIAECIYKKNEERFIPVIIYTAKNLTQDEDARLRRISKAVISKDPRAPERLLDELSICLHRHHGGLSQNQQEMIDRLHRPEEVLARRKVLVVDDDIRNIFAMTSLLERYGMLISSAEDGKEAIRVLNANPDIEIVLMDIMMPGMDGYDTMRSIRSMSTFKSLPIIALTAKAMKGDREKCLEAGASDYISKPVDAERLLGFLRIWLSRGHLSVTG